MMCTILISFTVHLNQCRCCGYKH